MRRTTFGSKFYEHNVPEFDGAVTGRLKAAGAIVLGKTNTPSWGHKDMCDNLLGPPTRNPWKLDRTSGASSGGAGAAVAAGVLRTAPPGRAVRARIGGVRGRAAVGGGAAGDRYA